MESNAVTDIIEPTEKPKVDTRPKGIPIEDILEYHAQGLTDPEIGKLLGITRETVCRRRLKADVPGLKRYKKHRADSFTSLGRRMLNSITDDDINDMSPHQRVVAGAIIYDKERLERGQSTQNISAKSTVEHVNETIDTIKAEMDALRGEDGE